MTTALKWVEMLLQNSKAIGGLLLLLISALGFTSYTAVDQHNELQTLRKEVVVEIPVEVQVKHDHGYLEHDHGKITSDIKTNKAEIKELKRWH